MLTEQIQTLQTDLEESERSLVNRVNAALPRDLDSLDRMVVEQKDFESRIETYESRIQTIQRTYSSIQQKTTVLQAKVEKVIEKWERVWTLSNLYSDRLKRVEVVLKNLEDTTNMVSKFEVKLGSYDNMPTDENEIRKVGNMFYLFTFKMNF